LRPITALVEGAWSEGARRGLEDLVATGLVGAIRVVGSGGGEGPPAAVAGVPVERTNADEPGAGPAVAGTLEAVETPYLMQLRGGGVVDPEPRGVARMVAAADASGAPLVYGDFVDAVGGERRPHPLADYQLGSLGDRFEFGPLALWSTAALRRAVAAHGAPADDLRWHGWYDLRLKASLAALPLRLPEPLASRAPEDERASGAAVFDYLLVQREAQLEAERVATEHLERLGARVVPPFAPFPAGGEYPVEASVVIPVRDRLRTVADAVGSALAQRADFPFNVIVVDNHSTDGTTALLAGRARDDDRLIHVIPERRDLGIGGCWNEAAFHPACGRYLVQLDSDDLYEGEGVLERVVGLLRGESCGMVIGSYSTVDFDLQPLPPGLIDHREWSDDNGPNNALRIDGLGAPRCFASELVRRHPLPNVSYGEDYALALRISREYRVGRIYDSLYHCRRWDDNTDAALSAAAVASHQRYKDRIRTLEIQARQRAGAAE